MMEELIKELKEEIIKALNLEEMTPEDIDENEFGLSILIINMKLKNLI